MARRDWAPILARAAAIVLSYSTAVTLRQLHYRLVSDPEIDYRNTLPDYKQLSARTAELRRFGGFPPLADLTRGIERVWWNESAGEAVQEALENFQLDRSRGQDPLPFIVVEKATLTMQVRSWVDEQTIPVVALRGYSSETLDTSIENFVNGQKREVRLLYVGDFDATGEDIERNLREQTFLDTERIAVTHEQIGQYGLPVAPGKSSDSRAGRFLANHGQLVQVEVEALDPNVLRGLVQDAIAETWDAALEQGVRADEKEQRKQLQAFADGFGEA